MNQKLKAEKSTEKSKKSKIIRLCSQVEQNALAIPKRRRAKGF